MTTGGGNIPVLGSGFMLEMRDSSIPTLWVWVYVEDARFINSQCKPPLPWTHFMFILHLVSRAPCNLSLYGFCGYCPCICLWVLHVLSLLDGTCLCLLDAVITFPLVYRWCTHVPLQHIRSRSLPTPLRPNFKNWQLCCRTSVSLISCVIKQEIVVYVYIIMIACQLNPLLDC